MDPSLPIIDLVITGNNGSIITVIIGVRHVLCPPRQGVVCGGRFRQGMPAVLARVCYFMFKHNGAVPITPLVPYCGILSHPPLQMRADSSKVV